MMLKLLEFLWSGCFHNWETIKEQDMFVSGCEFRNGKEYETRHTYTEYVLRCKNCGEIKSVKVGLVV